MYFVPLCYIVSLLSSTHPRFRAFSNAVQFALSAPFGVLTYIGLTNPDGLDCNTAEKCNGNVRWVDGDAFKKSKYPSLPGVNFVIGVPKYPGAFYKSAGDTRVGIITSFSPAPARFICEFTL